MSSENDQTVQVPTTGPGTPTAPIRRSATGGPTDGPAAEPPTTPVPQAGARHAGDPTRPLPTTAGTPTESLGAPVPPASGSTGTPADRPAERPTDRPTERLTDRVTDRTADRTADPAAGRPDRSVDPVTPRGDGVGDGDARTGRAPLRVGTVVWGLVLAVIGAGIIAVAAGAQIDVELALITLLALAGVGLVVGSVATGVRRRH